MDNGVTDMEYDNRQPEYFQDDVITRIGREIAKHFDDECVKLFCLKALKALNDEGIVVNLCQSEYYNFNDDGSPSIEWTIDFKGIDTSEHDAKVIEEYKNGLDNTM